MRQQERNELKTDFKQKLGDFVESLKGHISTPDNQWTIKGFIDIFRNIYTISADTKIVSKILEIHLFPKLLEFAKENNFYIVLAEQQNYYPDLSFVHADNEKIKFALDLKTTYRLPDKPEFCNGFTLGSHGDYFSNRKSNKNIQFPYDEYLGHFCLGIIYSRSASEHVDETRIYKMDELKSIVSVISEFQFFVHEKWEIASDLQGSSNTANIGSITRIEDILNGNGIFKNLGEKWFDDYWINYGKIQMTLPDGKVKKITTLKNYLVYWERSQTRQLNTAQARPKEKTGAEMTVKVPPLKCQGIKTKLTEWIKDHAALEESGTWFEPFMGSGVVGFNVRPHKAVFADINPHIVNFYNAIKDGGITAGIAKEFLEHEGEILQRQGDSYYYEVRERFNKDSKPLDLLFLNRACFNGVMRFNKKGWFNVPFGHKPQRFVKAYITKISNQIKYVSDAVSQYDWTFVSTDFRKLMPSAAQGDFIYCDPPYIGRHVDYYNSWGEQEEQELCNLLSATPAKFILSTWHSNRYRNNPALEKYVSRFTILTREHFYHVGASEANRNPMLEAIVLNYNPMIPIEVKVEKQLALMEKSKEEYAIRSHPPI